MEHNDLILKNDNFMGKYKLSNMDSNGFYQSFQLLKIIYSQSK